jgi:hypothetical protein
LQVWSCNVLGMETTSKATETSTVTAEDAPLGVQLWPTLTPQQAPNFTLWAVEIVRNEARTYVRWIYHNGNVRTFKLGEQVAVQFVGQQA